MKATQNPATPVTNPTDPPPATDPCAESPAAVLRHAAIYLWRYGWCTDTFYPRDLDAKPVAFPPACVAGAIRCAVFGHPVELLHDDDIKTEPDHPAKVALVMAAQDVLARTVDPFFSDEYTGPLDTISTWNDTPGRTIGEVLVDLYFAADDWDANHPTITTGTTVKAVDQ